jgi:isopentenyl-diphosphate delta-isomerase
MDDIGARKSAHLELCATGEVGFLQTTTLLGEVALVHDSLPELALDEVELGCELLGKRLRAPLVVSAMTGGTPAGGRINAELAAVAEELGLGFALGSQRPMLEDEALAATYQVRRQAPTTLVVGNLGLWQVRRAGASAVEALARGVGADAMAIHLNPAQEIVQPGGDRDFRGGLELLATLRAELTVPLVVKETGCGLGPAATRKLRGVGVDHVDVAGAGGTSWVGVEAHRASDPAGRVLGAELREWGVPTAAAVALASKAGFATLIASGGVATGLDAARAIALGASAVGVARPVLQAWWRGGAPAARALLEGIVAGLRAVMALTGSADLVSLRRAPRVVGPQLAAWLAQLD